MGNPKVSKPKAAPKPKPRAKATPKEEPVIKPGTLTGAFDRIHEHLDKATRFILHEHKASKEAVAKIRSEVLRTRTKTMENFTDVGVALQVAEGKTDKMLDHLVALKYTTVIVGVVAVLALAGVIYIIF